VLWFYCLSSRRRHTRSQRDWSSDVCSSDLISELGPELEERDIVKSNAAFQAAAASNTNAGDIQPGFYRLQGQMSGSAAVEALLDEENRVDMLAVHGGSTLMDINVLGGDTRYGIFSLIEAVTCNDGQCVNKQELENTAAT